ncbi:hypothetical protein JB92DRAFT_2692579 [Gautieria morchelliformis]|nr:hypothetical protein JB92DRAFT_2692579 [Gautieria morchelliformis]
MSLPSASRIRPRHMRSSSAGSSNTIGLGGDSLHAQRPARTPAPEPVPNLTKKSRGRRVPTAAALYGGYGPASASSSGSIAAGGKNARTYVCKVKECGKCFARSEHLKRHVRSIHTNEKPHRCPHSGCSKEFSRHDNLCQHMRVHRNFSAPKDGPFGSF